jgi:hypothetical protein
LSARRILTTVIKKCGNYVNSDVGVNIDWSRLKRSGHAVGTDEIRGAKESFENKSEGRRESGKAHTDIVGRGNYIQDLKWKYGGL